MSTYAEVLTRRQEWWRNWEPTIEGLSRDLRIIAVDLAHDIRVPLIKYGRRKRRYRSLLPHHIKVDFDIPETKP